MKKFLILVTIIFLLISTNLITLGLSISITFYMVDNSWGQYTNKLESKIEYELLSAFHRKCMKALGENGLCNETTKEIYQSYKKGWTPVFGFDWPYITEPDLESG